MMNENRFQTDNGWIIRFSHRTADLENVLDEYGFNLTEKADFIEYWAACLDPGKDYCMFPQETERVNALLPVFISPAPDSLHRIWFYFSELESGKSVNPPVQIERISRAGFAVVEWGGMMQ